MRTFLVLGLLLLNCGGNTTTQMPYVGIWSGVSTTDKVMLFPDGVFQYTGDDGCKTTGTYTSPGNLSSGNIPVEITNSEASLYCLQTGKYNCTFHIGNGILYFFCSGNDVITQSREYKKTSNNDQVSTLEYYIVTYSK